MFDFEVLRRAKDHVPFLFYRNDWQITGRHVQSIDFRRQLPQETNPNPSARLDVVLRLLSHSVVNGVIACLTLAGFKMSVHTVG